MGRKIAHSYLFVSKYTYYVCNTSSHYVTCLTIAKMPERDSAGRIAILTEKIGAIQKRYAKLKAEVAYLDRKKRRAKQREREGEYT